MLKDLSMPAVAAGFLAVLVSYAGPLIIFFTAAQSAHASTEMISSWVWAISVGSAVSGIALSWWFKVPVVTAWSAPGTALLVSLFPAMSLNQAAGAYISAAAILFVIGVSGYFDKLIRLIPKGIASAMMAGILFQFGTGVFTSVKSAPELAFGMIAAYLVLKRLFPRYCLVLLLVIGVGLAVGLEGASLDGVALTLATPVFIRPEWTWHATLSLAVPLVMVSLTGQLLPGMAILRGAGYDTPARPLIAVTSAVSAAVAFFGGITIVLAAITAALCTDRNAHEDPARRYIAGIASGVFFLVGGCFAGTIVLLFTALPATFIAVLAGLALLGAIGSNLVAMAGQPGHLDASVITFLATASGMTLFGLGSAFWGVVIGTFAYLLLHKPWRVPPSEKPNDVPAALGLTLRD